MSRRAQTSDGRRPTDRLTLAHERVLRLQAALQRDLAQPVRLVETHISWVLLAGEFAYKLKKPVRLPFVDFRSLAMRRRCCAEEVRLNRRLAPGVYLGVALLRDGPDGPSFGAQGRVLDVAVRMRRFDNDALWSVRVTAGRIAAHDVDRLARRLADFHRDAAVAPVSATFGSAALQQRTTTRLLEGLEACGVGKGATSDAADWAMLRGWLADESRALAPAFEARRHAGRVREGHGDLHLANLIQLGDAPTAFDAIEFDPALRWIDVLDDIAFAAMDLMAHGATAHAFRFIDAYLEAGAEHDGVPLLRYFLVRRALVRALVAALSATQGRRAPAGPGGGDYVALALALARNRGSDARLAITHGLPGSGKSYVSQTLLEHAGAIRVRSDVERKRLFGLDPLASSHGRVPQGIYGADATARTYARLRDLACTALRSGWPVIVDAAFLRSDERAEFADLAREEQVPFVILDCRAPAPVLRERLTQRQARGGDPSEADAEVLDRLQAVAEPLDAGELAFAITVDATNPVPAERLAARWRAEPTPKPASSIGAASTDTLRERKSGGTRRA